MRTKGPLDAPVTSRSVVGGATWGLHNGFDVAPRGARAPHARPRARPFPVTARFGHPLLENRFSALTLRDCYCAFWAPTSRKPFSTTPFRDVKLGEDGAAHVATPHRPLRPSLLYCCSYCRYRRSTDRSFDADFYLVAHQTSGVTSRKGAFFGQVKNLARATSWDCVRVP